MDLTQIGYAAEMFFRMCREHPEICPHDYHWANSISDKMHNIEIKKYICGLCGKELEEKNRTKIIEVK